MKQTIMRWLVVAIVIFALGGALAFFALPLKGHVPILMYHFVVPREQVGPTSLDVSQDVFERQMWFLKTFGYRPITLDALYETMQGRRKAEGKEMVITFDDGNQSYADYALPILTRYGVPSANFLVWENVVKKLSGSMDVSTVRRISHHPLVTLGSHTLSHPALPQLNLDQTRKEIMDSKANLEVFLDQPIRYFTCPTGRFDEQTILLAQEAGYDLLLTTSRSRVPEGVSVGRYTLTRMKIGPNDNLFRFWLKVSGIMSFADHFKNMGDCHRWL